MISRRTLLGTGAGVAVLAVAGVVGERTHRLDDLARAIGLEPRRRPARSDEALLRGARADLSSVLARTRAISTGQATLADPLAPLLAVTAAQLEQLGGALPGIDTDAPPTGARAAIATLIAAFERAEKARFDESSRAVSSELAQVLASLSASLAQSVAVLRALSKARS